MYVKRLLSLLMSRKMTLFLFLQLCCLALAAQVKIAGKVTDKGGAGILGISVTVKGTSSGASTNGEGNYSFTADLKPGSYDLVFSGVGFKASTQSLRVGSADSYTVNTTLSSDALGLDEVVVIGSTLSQSKKQLGNSINTVSAKQLANSGTGNLSAALQGKVPGAQITQTGGDPAGAISVRMRGTSSILGSSEPLYVIDGVVMNNSTNNVTNLNVDVSNTGSAGSSRADVANAASIGTNRMADINPNDIERMEIINGAAAAAIYGSRASNGVVLITTKKGKAGKAKVDFQTSINLNELRKKVKINLVPEQFGTAALRLYTISDNTPSANTILVLGRNLATNKVPVTRYDYQDEIFHKGLGTDNSVSISGGGDKTKAYMSAGYLYNQGIVKNADFRRINLRGRIDHQLNSWISTSLGVAYSSSLSHEKPNGNVFWSPVNSVNITNNIYDITQRDAYGNLKAVEPTRVNPLSIIETFNIRQEVNRAITDLQVNLRPVKGLKIDYILGFDTYSQEGNTYIPIYPYAGVNTAYYDKGYASYGDINSFQLNSDINVTYQVDFAEKFSSTTVAGYNLQFSKQTSLITAGRDLQVGVTTVNGAANPALLSGKFVENQVARYLVQGGFIQQTFGYNNQLFLTLAARIDGSTVFAKDNRNQFFPKLSASYVISEGNWWQNASFSKWLNTAKLRFSYGQSGNLTGVGAYSRFFILNPGILNGVSTYNTSSIAGNPDIKIEKHKEYEGGIDLGFIDNRIGASFTYYDKRAIDGSLLVFRAIAPSTGAGSVVQNIGTVSNKGWEAMVNAQAVRKKDFTYDVTAIVSHNKNKVLDAGPGLIRITNLTGAPSVVRTGDALGVFYGTYYARDDKGNIRLDARGIPLQDFSGSTALLKVIGDPNPTYIFSLNNQFTYKRFGLNFLVDGVTGNQVFNADKRTRQGVGVGDYAEKELKGELPRGYIWGIYNIEEFRVDDGKFIKLREVGLTYQLPAIKWISSSSVSLVGRNLISWDDYNGYDPETNAGGNGNTLRGIDFGNVPIPRTYQLVFRASF